MKIRDNFFTEQEIEKLHKATVRVLSEVGVEFNTKDALELFRQNNVKVEGKKVFIDEDTLWKALNTVPSEFTLSGRTEKDDVLVGGGSTVYAPASGPVFVQKDNERRSTTGEDYIDLLKIFQTSEIIPVINANMTEPQDIDFEERDNFRLKNCLEMTTKPLMGFTTGRSDSEGCISAIKGFYKGTDKHVVLGVISPVSPLCFDESMIEGMNVYARENQPVLIASCSLPGATSPVTMAGTLVTNNAEVLAGIVYTQLLRPGLPVIYGGTSSSCDMRMVTPAIGSPETGLFTYGYRALSAHYGMPCRSGGSLTDSSTTDMQAGIESTYSILSASIAGVDYVLQSCGILESFNALCFEKIIIDEENIKMAKRYVSGFEINDETIAFDVIKKVGSEGTYITSDHTYANFRDTFIQASLFSKEPYENWEMNGKKDVFEAAKEVLVKRLEGYRKPELTEEQVEYLKSIEVTV
jgi:trimethylamine--corrinoid protein Co-methyltransferase